MAAPGRVLFVDDIITAIRSHMNIVGDTTAFPDTTIVEAINKCEDQIFLLVVGGGGNMFSKSLAYDGDASTTEFALPADLYSIEELVDYNKEPIEICRRRDEFTNYEPTSSSASSLGNIAAIIKSGNIVTNYAPATKTSYMTLYYYSLFPWVHQGAISAYVAETPSVTLDSASSSLAGHFLSIDDIYNGMEIKMTSGDANKEIKTITDFVGSTGVATIDSAFTATPASADTYDLATYYPYPILSILIEGAIAWLKGGKDEQGEAETNFMTKWEMWYKGRFTDPSVGVARLLNQNLQERSIKDTYSCR